MKNIQSFVGEPPGNVPLRNLEDKGGEKKIILKWVMGKVITGLK
jgi:hypothetical protein